jgi:glycosyltransferase involved in cell wall biosynthesis
MQASSSNEVWVVTSSLHKEPIESYLAEFTHPTSHFLFIDTLIPHSLIVRLPGSPYLHYFLWQISAFFVARRLHRQVDFDLGHHVTYGALRFPTFLAGMKLPYVWGPIGAAERMERRFWVDLRIQDKLHSLLRSLSTRCALLDPFVRLSASRAAVILVTTPATLDWLPKKYYGKAIQTLAIGTEASPSSFTPKPATTQLKLLFVGRLLYWKGAQFAVRAVAAARAQGTDVTLTIVGSGPFCSKLKSLVKSLSVQPSVRFVPWVDHSDLISMYGDYDVLVLPSFQDSGGSVVLEAISAGLTAIVLDRGGPSLLIDSNVGMKISTSSSDQIVADLAAAFSQIAVDKQTQFSATELRPRNYEKKWSWDRLGPLINDVYDLAHRADQAE